jgi:glycine cleavage system transcriptional repressor
MKRIIISVLGEDRPGIIAAVSKTLFEVDCNVENVSQTILQSEFAGIFIVSMPGQLSTEDVSRALEKRLAPLDLHFHVKDLKPSGAEGGPPPPCEPFVITTVGPDRKGLVANITEIIARYRVNVTNLQAVFKGGDDPNQNIMIYEVDVPDDIDQKTLYSELRKKAAELGLDISIQHRNIFKAINRI